MVKDTDAAVLQLPTRSVSSAETHTPAVEAARGSEGSGQECGAVGGEHDEVITLCGCK